MFNSTTLAPPALSPSQVQMVKRHAAFRYGWSLRESEVFDGATVNMAELNEDERRGYRAACRAEADSSTKTYLMEVSR